MHGINTTNVSSEVILQEFSLAQSLLGTPLLSGSRSLDCIGYLRQPCWSKGRKTCSAPLAKSRPDIICSKGEMPPVSLDHSTALQSILSYLRPLRAPNLSHAQQTSGEGAATPTQDGCAKPGVTLLEQFVSKGVMSRADNLASPCPQNAPLPPARASPARPSLLLSSLAPSSSTTHGCAGTRALRDQKTRARVDGEFGNTSSVSKHSFP